MSLEKIQQKLNENDYSFFVREDHLNELDFVHVNLVEKLSRFFPDDNLDIQWNDNPSVELLLKIKNDVYFDVSIDSRKDNLTKEASLWITGIYIPIDLPTYIFNKITSKLFNYALVEKRKHGSSEYIYFWWD